MGTSQKSRRAKGGMLVKLALSNIYKNIRTYLPFVLSSALTVMMFYIILYLKLDTTLSRINGGSGMYIVLGFGVYVVGIFALIFLFYTNSFITKRRRREFGLYNTLGMEKRHIGRLILLEDFFTSAVSIVCGLLFGILFSKLVLAIAVRIIGEAVPFGFYISYSGIIITVAVFAAIFTLTMIYDLIFVFKTRPIDLLNSKNAGEREPKARWLLTLFGVITLGCGYAMAISIKDPVEAMALFFVAVILVIIGTYCLFSAGIIAWLKLMRKNKGYYYKPHPFINISGMLYRMKQNAVGLANICILSTMFLVTISGTAALYFGFEASFNENYLYDMSLKLGVPMEYDENHEYLSGEGATKADLDVMRQIFDKTVLSDANGKKITEYMMFRRFYLSNAQLTDGVLEYKAHTPSYYATIFVYAEDTDIPMGEKEIIVWKKNGKAPVINGGRIVIAGQSFSAVVAEADLGLWDGEKRITDESLYIIMKNDEVAGKITNALLASGADFIIDVRLNFNSKLTAEENTYFTSAFSHNLESTKAEGHLDGNSNYYISTYINKEVDRYDMICIYGGLFFIGIFLGLLFLMATVLIIYYKQVSEGYDDRERFRIMQNVGMSHREVRGCIDSQVRTVFFLPLITAMIHVAFAFPMLDKCLTIFGVGSTLIWAVATVSTIAAFSLIYVLVYRITAKAYYRIVEV